jgi:hypothetical protein
MQLRATDHNIITTFASLSDFSSAPGSVLSAFLALQSVSLTQNQFEANLHQKAETRNLGRRHLEGVPQYDAR